MAVLAAIIAAFAIAAFRKRNSATEVEAARPQFARNIAERLMLTTEMDAARQAQLRVMPRRVPNVDGVQLAAKHSFSAELGTDYYEFFPSATHLGVAVADARLPGLSSALCISMLKGLLLNYAARLEDPRDLADRVYRQLSSIFGDDLPVSFFFGRLDRDADRSRGAFAFATFGAAPHAILVRAGNATSLEGEEYVELAASSDARRDLQRAPHRVARPRRRHPRRGCHSRRTGGGNQQQSAEARRRHLRSRRASFARRRSAAKLDRGCVRAEL